MTANSHLTISDVREGLRNGSGSSLVAYCGQQAERDWPDEDEIRAELRRTTRAIWPQLNRGSIAEFAHRAPAHTSMPVILTPLFAEAIIRASFGEEHLTLGLPPEYVIPWSIALIELLDRQPPQTSPRSGTTDHTGSPS